VKLVFHQTSSRRFSSRGTRPPDHGGHLILGRPRRTHSASGSPRTGSNFVVTCSGADSKTSGRDSFSDCRGLRRATPISRRSKFYGPPLPLGRFLSFSLPHVFRAFAVSTFDVYAQSRIGSEHDLYASTSLFCFRPPPPPFSPHFIFAYSSPFFLFLYPRLRAVYSGLLLASSFLPKDHRSSPLSATTCDKNGEIDQNYVSSAIHFVCVYTLCLHTRYT
jgi:hypothetical protein